PVMERLAAESGENANLGVLEKDRVLNIHKVAGPRPISLHIDAPGGVEAYATGLGKVLLAALDPAEVERRLAGARLIRLTPTTVTGRRALRVELRRVRTQGHAVDNEECSVGIRAVAAPVRDRTGSVVAALSVAGPSHRMTRERITALAPSVMEAVREISKRLGYVVGTEDTRSV
ncbi:MAG: IclR family transcriptional regulator, partial [candidate division NC10 bacterium]